MWVDSSSFKFIFLIKGDLLWEYNMSCKAENKYLKNTNLSRTGPKSKSFSGFLQCYLVKIRQKCSNGTKTITWALPLAAIEPHPHITSIGLFPRAINITTLSIKKMVIFMAEFGQRTAKPFFGSQNAWLSIGGENFYLDQNITDFGSQNGPPLEMLWVDRYEHPF